MAQRPVSSTVTRCVSVHNSVSLFWSAYTLRREDRRLRHDDSGESYEAWDGQVGWAGNTGGEGDEQACERERGQPRSGRCTSLSDRPRPIQNAEDVAPTERVPVEVVVQNLAAAVEARPNHSRERLPIGRRLVTHIDEGFPETASWNCHHRR
jgi:hypothetical protein